jgi:hypothetical protein
MNCGHVRWNDHASTMAPTIFAEGWRADVDQRIATDPAFATGLHTMLVRLNDRTQPPAALDDVISQPWRQLRRDWYDAAAQIEVGLHLQAGWYVSAAVEVGATPGGDKDQVGNGTKLKGLPLPFNAWFDGGAGDCDGWFAWDEPVEVRHHMGDGEHLTVRYPVSGVPLEVGRTEPETTIWHLRRDGGVARWPYGSTCVTLLLATTSTAGAALALQLPAVISGTMRVPPPPRAAPPI